MIVVAELIKNNYERIHNKIGFYCILDKNETIILFEFYNPEIQDSMNNKKKHEWLNRKIY